MRSFSLLPCIVLLTPVFLPSQTKPAAKPLAKPQTSSKTAPALGTAQMPGDNGQVGVTYQLGGKEEALNLTLESAEFALRSPMLEDTILATGEQKLLVLTFAVQNPLSRDQILAYNSFNLTCVSPDDANLEFDGWIYHPERKARLETTLKPAQKSKFIAVFPIHGTGPVNKLIVKRGQDTPVLRYDLRGKVTPLTGVFASDQGVSAKTAGEAKIGEVFPFGRWNVAVEKVEESTEDLGDYQAGEDGKLVVVTLGITNMGAQPYNLSYSTFQAEMTDQNSESFEFMQDLLRMTAAETLSQDTKAGVALKGRMIFRGTREAKPTAFSITDPETGRTVKISLAK